MTSNDDSAPTSAGTGPEHETTIVPPPTEAAPELAWSDETEAPAQGSQRTWRITWISTAALILSTAVLAGVVGLIGWVVRPAPTAHAPTVPSPSTVTVQAAPPISAAQSPPSPPSPTTQASLRPPTSTPITTTAPSTPLAAAGAAMGLPCSASDHGKLAHDPNTARKSSVTETSLVTAHGKRLLPT